jgi:hypothetical protein
LRTAAGRGHLNEEYRMSRLKSRRNLGRFAPQVEALEDRSLLSVTVSPAGTLLTITANGTGNNNVTITDTNGSVAVSANGSSLGTFTGIVTVDYEGNSGKDTVVYILQGTGPTSAITGTHNLIARLKQGDDQFTGIIAGDLGTKSGSSTAQVNLGTGTDSAVAGGPGADTISLLDTKNIWTGSSLTVFGKTGPSQPSGGSDNLTVSLFGGEIAGTVSLNLSGTQGSMDKATITVNVFDMIDPGGVLSSGIANGNGRNTDTFNFVGVDNGTLSTTITGGSNKDVLDTEIGLQSGSKGMFTVSESGVHNSNGNGLDKLTEAIRNLGSNTATGSGILDGGGNTGNCFNTSNVIAFNFKTDTIIS